MTDVQGDMQVGDEWGSIAPDFLEHVEKALANDDQKAVRAATRASSTELSSLSSPWPRLVSSI